ncbi:hypothetical protein [Metabacillus fastidiosus]|uniref:Uncharacterized protein n=1 Tax=Metabacillus fastidiosus TaxID=1458 RepID=A0ABU6NVL4_9BACI|nr:hypothetical protein [Metabacillus fastidiosus]
MTTLRFFVSQIIQEQKSIELPTLAQKLQTSEAHLHIILEQLMEADANIHIEDDVVY